MKQARLSLPGLLQSPIAFLEMLMKHAAAERDALFLCRILQQAIALSAAAIPGRLPSGRMHCTSGVTSRGTGPAVMVTSDPFHRDVTVTSRVTYTDVMVRSHYVSPEVTLTSRGSNTDVISLRRYFHHDVDITSLPNRPYLSAHPRCSPTARPAGVRNYVRVFANAFRCFWEEIKHPGPGAPGFFYQFFYGRGPLETVPLANRQPFLQKRQCSWRLQ